MYIIGTQRDKTKTTKSQAEQPLRATAELKVPLCVRES